jgi:hypothetical protein
MLRRFVQLVAITGAAMALLAPTAGAAPAAEPSSPGILACHTPDPPTQTPGWVHGRGSGSCAQEVDVFLQRLRAWGWDIEATAHYRGPGSAIASWNCSGSGHYTYRTLVQWRDGAGVGHSEYSAERRFAC